MTPNMAVLMAEAAAKAYETPEAFLSWLDGVGGQGLKFFEQADTQAYGFETATARVVAFRGTEPNRLSDWQTDLRLHRMVLGLQGMVHEGFAEALGLVWAPIEQWLAEPGGKPVWITGHSLGGALAILAGARVAGASVYTFGQPRVGDSIFAVQAEAKLGARYCRFVHNRDIVSRVPPYTMGFRHFGREFLIRNGQVVEVDDGVETVDDAVQLIVGPEVKIPKRLDWMLESILRVVESSLKPEQLGPAIDFVRRIQSQFGWLGGETMQVFVDQLVGYMRSHQVSGGPVIGPIDDHDTRHYIAALKAS